jgi:hypothetical protein
MGAVRENIVSNIYESLVYYMMEKDFERLIVSQDKPLNLNDNLLQTYGCRHTNPNICKTNSLEDICAFVRFDSICKKPPLSWKKIFNRLIKRKKHK